VSRVLHVSDDTDDTGRILYSFYITRGGKKAVELLATERGEKTAETVRTLLRYAMQHMPPDWRP
jgi:hypothetical protein